MKYYSEIKISSEPFLPEIISGLLWDLDIQGIVEETDHIRVFLNEENLSAIPFVKKTLERLKTEKVLDIYNIDVSTFEDKNWNEEWERGVKTIHVTDRIVINPSFRKYEAKENELVLTIDPKMSFGTGEHQTTRLILQMLEKYVKPGIKVLDAGTGTGILAIAAVKLGAESAVAFDNDEWCYNNAKENTEQNGAADKIDIRICEVKDVKETGFDLVLANIQKNILMDIAEDLAKKTKSGGILILSGLLQSDEEDITARYRDLGFSIKEKAENDEWIALSFKNDLT